ncbi:MAG: hypothetical protein K0U47_12535 [Epsilonproteobacteria bacterium]|nr:hypothetical protein [Campylobacterota bacterium]
MNTLDKELESRKSEIKLALKLLYEANSHITGWDIPEVDDKEASKRLFEVMQEALDELKKENQ